MNIYKIAQQDIPEDIWECKLCHSRIVGFKYDWNKYIEFNVYTKNPENYTEKFCFWGDFQTFSQALNFAQQDISKAMHKQPNKCIFTRVDNKTS
jgi:hypothetical protein